VILLETGRPSGFESLIRIEHPEKGLIPPGDFITVAENSAIIFPLGLWIIEEVCRQIEYWKTKFILDTPLRININLSARQFIHPQLTSHIFEIIDKYSIDFHDIGFELTESAFMEDMESANISLLELRSKKFTLYMDDFGTGYSSLSYLMHFPVDIIKIDQSFVKWMHIDEQSETLVKSLVSLAHNLGLKVVAEGVDDESHIEILKECGCDYGQGYLFSKPLPSDKADNFLSQFFKTRID
jgi:EAL domain-containing protein (putative c-di-GMP-specific phosphodiesterase class I)